MSRVDAPPWPSLYDPGLEILNIAHRNRTQPGGAYLYHPQDVFRFTLYWTLCFYTPLFLLCGTYAFWNFNFPPRLRTERAYLNYDDADRFKPFIYPLRHLSASRYPSTANTTRCPVTFRKEQERRSRLTSSFLVFLVFLMAGVAGAVMGSAILGFTAYGLYQSGGFVMSTWIPFLLAVMQALIGLFSVWPSIIEII